MSEIYTIGYAGFEVKNFLDTLKKYDINFLADVRSVPHSKYFQDFDQENLSRLLSQNKILYRNYAEEFGARQLDKNFYTDGVLDFEKFAKSDKFQSGVKKISQAMQSGYKFVLMCAEKRPENCHRNILVARQFYKLGCDVRNILSDGNYLTQGEVEKILVDKYFPNINQLSLFEELSFEEIVRQSYARRNKEIGFRLEQNFYEDDLHDRFHEEDGGRIF